MGEFHTEVIFSYRCEQRKNTKGMQNILEMKKVKKREKLEQELAMLDKAIGSSILGPGDFSE